MVDCRCSLYSSIGACSLGLDKLTNKKWLTNDKDFDEKVKRFSEKIGEPSNTYQKGIFCSGKLAENVVIEYNGGIFLITDDFKVLKKGPTGEWKVFKEI